ncbi:MAG: hypothetical protein R2709_15170 [Marmoricola sp.]
MPENALGWPDVLDGTGARRRSRDAGKTEWAMGEILSGNATSAQNRGIRYRTSSQGRDHL